MTAIAIAVAVVAAIIAVIKIMAIVTFLILVVSAPFTAAKDLWAYLNGPFLSKSKAVNWLAAGLAAYVVVGGLFAAFN